MQNPRPKRTLSIAPMLDWTDRHFRYLARQISRHTWLYTEMINAGAIIHGDPARFLAYNESEHPIALQLGAATPRSWRERRKKSRNTNTMKSTSTAAAPARACKKARSAPA